MDKLRSLISHHFVGPVERPTAREVLNISVEGGVDLILEEMRRSNGLSIAALIEFTRECCELPFFCDIFGIAGYRALQRLSGHLREDDDIKTILAVLKMRLSLSSNKLLFPVVVKDVVKTIRLKHRKSSLLHDNDDCNVHVTDIYLRDTGDGTMHGIGQAAVGLVPWASAHILCSWCAPHLHALFRNKRVVEIGSGVGICGMFVSSVAASVTLTDFDDKVLENLSHNVALNEGLPCIRGIPPAIPASCEISIEKLDWRDIRAHSFDFTYSVCDGFGLNHINPNIISSTRSSTSSSVREKRRHVHVHGEENRGDVNDDQKLYDIILGSDVVCCEDDAIGVAKAAHKLLSSTGLCIFVVPRPEHRYGTDALVPALSALGFETASRAIVHSTCVATYRKHWTEVRSTYQLGSPVANLAIALDNLFESDKDGIFSRGRDQQLKDDEMLEGLDESGFHSWLLIIAQKSHKRDF